MKIGVIGGGVVGHATARAFMEHAEVRVYDAVKERTTHDLIDTLDTDLTFVCLPETTILPFFQETIGKGYSDCCLIIKSTVPVGTTRLLQKQFTNIVHSPEFLTARRAVTDAQLPARNIIGSPWFQHGRGVGEGSLRLRKLYRERFPDVPILEMSSDESELVKLTVNSFFAVKVAYFNEAYSLCDRLGLSWDRVLNGVLTDGRIAHSHTQVPGPDGKFGFGGACLPKDITQLINVFLNNGLIPAVCLGAVARNSLDRERG